MAAMALRWASKRSVADTMCLVAASECPHARQAMTAAVDGPNATGMPKSRVFSSPFQSNPVDSVLMRLAATPVEEAGDVLLA
jgi:hypothetical protein